MPANLGDTGGVLQSGKSLLLPTVDMDRIPCDEIAEGRARVRAPDRSLRIVQATAISVDQAALGRGDEFAERGDPVLPWHPPEVSRGVRQRELTAVGPSQKGSGLASGLIVEVL